MAANAPGTHEFHWIEERLSLNSTIQAHGCQAVCAFVNDQLDAPVLTALAATGVRLVVLRCIGYGHVDLPTATALGLTIANVPTYSPYAVAEHALALILTLNRRTHLAHDRVRRGDFTLDGLVGFNLHGKTVGLVGTDRTGTIAGRILQCFGCRVIAFDSDPPEEAVGAGFTFVQIEELLRNADIVSIHCALQPHNRHFINSLTLGLMKANALLINTSRGALLDTHAVIDALENDRLGGLGIDVYEHEATLFFEDHSTTGIPDALFARLIALPTVVATGHQGFLTEEALADIASAVIGSLDAHVAGYSPPFAVH